MSLQDTPSANRIHIGFFGKRNVGKSSLLNAFCGQNISIVSDTPGTTTDPVSKAMEINGLGPCVLVDTAGFDEEDGLGEKRVEKTVLSAQKVDIACIVLDGYEIINGNTDFSEEKSWFQIFTKQNTSVIFLCNKSEVIAEAKQQDIQRCIQQKLEVSSEILFVSAKHQTGLTQMKQAMLRALPEGYGTETILGNLVEAGDIVLLVMPQDIQAPKGRLILPQVQTIRELLDKKCITICVTAENMTKALESLQNPPKLIITDSQVFPMVYKQKPAESLLTSFSVLFAALKGDITYYVESIKALEKLTEHSRILIAECCTHAPLQEDIGREKIPAMLHTKYGKDVIIDIVSGTDFPEDLSGYDFIVQCGGCMFHKKYVTSRVERAKKQKVPMTNYGILIAYMTGILPYVYIPN